MSHPTRPSAKPVAELIGPALDPVVRKRGLARADILNWWPEIVGSAYAGRTAPERIRWPRDGKAATLIVRCDPSAALAFSYEVDHVRERLNGFFGYPAVGAVRIVQQRIGEGDPRAETAPVAELTPEQEDRLEARLTGLDAPLKESLAALGRLLLARP